MYIKCLSERKRERRIHILAFFTFFQTTSALSLSTFVAQYPFSPERPRLLMCWSTHWHVYTYIREVWLKLIHINNSVLSINGARVTLSSLLLARPSEARWRHTELISTLYPHIQHFMDQSLMFWLNSCLKLYILPTSTIE